MCQLTLIPKDPALAEGLGMVGEELCWSQQDFTLSSP